MSDAFAKLIREVLESDCAGTGVRTCARVWCERVERITIVAIANPVRVSDLISPGIVNLVFLDVKDLIFINIFLSSICFLPDVAR